MNVPDPAVVDGAGGAVGSPSASSRSSCHAYLPAESASSARARALVRRWCQEWGIPAAVPAAEMVVTELVENAVRHTGTGADLTVQLAGGAVVIAVGDGGDAVPRLAHPAPDEPGGRGMQLIDMIAREWGVERCVTGKRVWASIAVG